MNKKNIFIFGGTIVTVILILTLLVRFTKMPNEERNGFNRYFLPGSTIRLQQESITLPLKKICGNTANKIFLTVPNPQWLIALDINSHHYDTFLFPIPLTKQIIDACNIMVDSPSIFLFANNVPAVYYGKLKSYKIDSVRLSTSIFTRSIKISPTSIIIRSLSKSGPIQIFKKINSSTGKVITESDIIKDQADGGFSTDGQLRYDNVTNRLIYVQQYRNGFYCMDTNLNLLYTAKTIDTCYTSSMHLKEIEFGTENRLMPSAARVFINEESSISNGKLFIVSRLKADNERHSNFKNNSVIDIYEINNGNYKGSLYIPNIKREKIKSFLVMNDRLVALYKNHVGVFKLNYLGL